jgi:nucleoside-diphosphate-sugar epimerase
VPVVELDLEQPEAIHTVVSEIRPRWIFNLAAHGAYSWQTDVERMVRVNVLAVAALRAAAAQTGAERLVHAGSSSEYGLVDHAPSEHEALAPNSDYAATKAAATLLLQQQGPRPPLTVILRCYSIYGPWEEPGRLMPTLVSAAAQGHLPPLVDREVARDFVFVDDAVEALLGAARQSPDPGSVLNVASGRQTTLAEVVDGVRAVLGVEAEPQWGSMERRAWDTPIWVGRPDRIREVLGWESTVPLEEGLRRTAAWLAERPELAARYA